MNIIIRCKLHVSGGRPVVYVGGGHDYSNKVELLDYTITEQWEESKWMSVFLSLKGQKLVPFASSLNLRLWAQSQSETMLIIASSLSLSLETFLLNQLNSMNFNVIYKGLTFKIKLIIWWILSQIDSGQTIWELLKSHCYFRIF